MRKKLVTGFLIATMILSSVGVIAQERKPILCDNGTVSSFPALYVNYINTWNYQEGVWYYFNTKGNTVTGWQSIEGKWYCFDNTGKMYRRCITPDGYRVGGDGSWIK